MTEKKVLTEEVSQIRSSFNLQEDALANLGKQIHELTDKLLPITRDEPNPESGKGVDRPEKVEFATRLDKNTTEIMGLAGMIFSLIEKCEL